MGDDRHLCIEWFADVIVGIQIMSREGQIEYHTDFWLQQIVCHCQSESMYVAMQLCTLYTTNAIGEIFCNDGKVYR